MTRVSETEFPLLVKFQSRLSQAPFIYDSICDKMRDESLRRIVDVSEINSR